MTNQTVQRATWKAQEIDPNVLDSRIESLTLTGTEYRYLIQMPTELSEQDKSGSKKRHGVVSLKEVISSLRKEYQGSLGSKSDACEVIFIHGEYESNKLFEEQNAQALTKHHSRFSYDLSDLDFAKMTVLAVHEVSHNPGRKGAPFYNARSKLIRKLLASFPAKVNQSARAFWHPIREENSLSEGVYLDVVVPVDLHKKLKG